MRRYLVLFKVFFSYSWKKSIYIAILLIGLLGVIFNYTSNIYYQTKEFLPDNMVYFQGELPNNIDGTVYQTMPLLFDKEDYINTENPFTTNVYVNLDDLMLKEKTDPRLRTVINEIKVLNGRMENIGVSYSFSNEVLNRNDINLKDEDNGIDHVIVGKLPRENEVLVGEIYANDYLMKNDLNSYEDLAGQKIKIGFEDCGDQELCVPDQEYVVSGVYAGDYANYREERLIIGGNEKIKKIYETEFPQINNGYLVEFGSKAKRDEFINITSVDYLLTRENLHKRDEKLLLNILIYLFFNILLLLLILKDYVDIKRKLDFYEIREYKKILILGTPFIILNVVISILIWFV